MAKSTTHYEVIIGTGDNDSDSTVKVALINANGEKSNSEKPAGYGPSGRDNYEKGSIEICTSIPYQLDGDPVQVEIEFSGDKWRLGGIWVTNQSTGKAWYSLSNKLIQGKYTTIDLTSLDIGVSGPQTYDKFGGNITTGSDGTNDKVSG